MFILLVSYVSLVLLVSYKPCIGLIWLVGSCPDLLFLLFLSVNSISLGKVPLHPLQRDMVRIVYVK